MISNVCLFHKGNVAFSKYLYDSRNNAIHLGGSSRSVFGFGIPLDPDGNLLTLIERALQGGSRAYDWVTNTLPAGVVILPDGQIVELIGYGWGMKNQDSKIAARTFPVDCTLVKAYDDDLAQALQAVLEETQSIEKTLAVASTFTLINPAHFEVVFIPELLTRFAKQPLVPFPWFKQE